MCTERFRRVTNCSNARYYSVSGPPIAMRTLLSMMARVRYYTESLFSNPSVDLIKIWVICHSLLDNILQRREHSQPLNRMDTGFVCTRSLREVAIHNPKRVMERGSQFGNSLSVNKHANILALALSTNRIDQDGCGTDDTVFGIQFN